MKKFTILVTALVLTFSFVACKKKKDEKKSDTPKPAMKADMAKPADMGKKPAVKPADMAKPAVKPADMGKKPAAKPVAKPAAKPAAMK